MADNDNINVELIRRIANEVSKIPDILVQVGVLAESQRNIQKMFQDHQSNMESRFRKTEEKMGKFEQFTDDWGPWLNALKWITIIAAGIVVVSLTNIFLTQLGIKIP